MLSIGGFFPGFRPEPAEIPPLRRLGFHLDSPVPGIDVRAEGYMAVTSNTVQLGGYFEAGISAAGCGAHGFLSIDAIVQFTPFHIRAEVSAGFEVEVFGITFCGVRLDGTFDGPGPVTIHGRLTVETFLKDFSFDETFTFGSSGGPPAVPPARAAQVLADEEVRPTALLAVGGIDNEVVLAPQPVPPGLAFVVPRGGVAWQQKRVPLTIPIDRLDGAPLGAAQRVTASVPNQTSATDRALRPRLVHHAEPGRGPQPTGLRAPPGRRGLRRGDRPARPAAAPDDRSRRCTARSAARGGASVGALRHRPCSTCRGS